MTFLRTLMIVTLMAAGATAQAEEEKVLNVYNWSDYIAKDTLAKFEAETGIKVTYDVYDSNEVLEGKLMAGRSGYDIAVPTGPFFRRQVRAGIYRLLDKAAIPNLANLDPTIMKQAAAYDKDNAHGIVYMWGTNGIGYNAAKVKEAAGEDAPVDSWALVFDPKWAKKVSACGLYMLDSPSEVIPSALRYLGLDVDSTNPDDHAKVEALLTKVRPYVTKFHSSEYISALANGDICVAMGWSGDVAQAADRADEADNGVTVSYSIPKEGAEIWFDIMGVLKDAPHPQNAMKFVQFILKPEITAAITNFVLYPNANDKATPLVDEEVRNDPTIYPTAEMMDTLFVTQTVPQKTERLRTRLWNRIRTGH